MRILADLGLKLLNNPGSSVIWSKTSKSRNELLQCSEPRPRCTNWSWRGVLRYPVQLCSRLVRNWRESLGADDRARTGDLDLGKVALYQLSYVRVGTTLADLLGSPHT